jgi:DNA-binding LacI/PurR family transcriptional regulator
MSSRPKYQQIFDSLLERLKEVKPGDRLPSVRALMADYKASQSSIERSLDELSRQGLVRRKLGSGIYAAGVAPRSRVLGVYTDGEVAPHSNVLFLQGARSVAEEQEFHVADFGPKNLFERQEAIFEEMDSMGFAGIIAALSTAAFFHLESDQLLTRFKHMDLPIVTCFPIPSVTADSVMPDYFSSFSELGARLRTELVGPVKFLCYFGMPSLARLQGFRFGLGSGIHVEAEVLEKPRVDVYQRVRDLIAEGWRGNLVVGVPPDAPGDLKALHDGPWAKGSDYKLVVALEQGDELPPGVCAHVMIKPSFKMGQVAAELLLRRVRGLRGEMVHMLIQHELISPQPE